MILTAKVKNQIKLWYHSPKQKGSMRSLKTFYKILKEEGKIKKLPYSDFQKIFATDPCYVKFVSTRKKKNEKYQHYRVQNLNQEIVTDLAFMQPANLKFENEGLIGFLVCVNVCSRLVSAEAIHSKELNEVLPALLKIFAATAIPETLYSDQEGYMKSKRFQQYLKSENIKLIFTKSKYKASLAEREIRYIKTSLNRFMSAQNTKNWHQYLEQIVTFQNNAYNEVIGAVPAKVNELNVYKILLKKEPKKHESFAQWYHKENKLQEHLRNKNLAKDSTAKSADGYFYIGQPVYINLSATLTLATSGDVHVSFGKTG